MPMGSIRINFGVDDDIIQYESDFQSEQSMEVFTGA